MDNQTKLAQAKMKVDSMIGLPNMAIRKGVARSGDPMTGFTEYNYKLLRDMGSQRWLFYCEWVDTDGQGNRIVLPHEVVIAIFRGKDAVTTQSRKLGAEKAKATIRSRQGKE